MRLGIDLGTTRTVVAACDGGNYPLLGFVGEASDADPCEWFPSIVAERRGELRFGLDAQAVASDPGWSCVRSFKRVLSGPEAAPDRSVQIGGVTLPIGELLERYLGALRQAILERSNLPVGLEGPLEAVIAVPANAHGTQRFLTLEAFRRAGFQVRAVLNEPSAAGFEYTHRLRKTLTSRREHIVVYDLGGGTFDASLVRIAERHHEVVTTAGVNQLGGDDFDEVLVGLCLETAGLAALAPPERAALRERCRAAKEALNPSSRRIVIDLDGIAAAPEQVTLAVSDFYARAAPLVERSVEAMLPVLAAARRIEDGEAGELAEIAGLYVVGGASALPLVGRVLRERFGRRVHRSPYSFGATAIGLAIAADEQQGFSLSDKLSRHVGVFREAESGRRIAFDPVFPQGTPVPGPGAPPLILTRRYQAAHNLGHFRYVEAAGVDAGGEPRGEVRPFGDALFPFAPELHGVDLAAVPVERLRGGPVIEERYTLDASGLVEVVIANLETGYARSFRLGEAV